MSELFFRIGVKRKQYWVARIKLSKKPDYSGAAKPVGYVVLIVVIAGIVYVVYKKISKGVKAVGEAVEDLGAGMFGEGSKEAGLEVGRMKKINTRFLEKFKDKGWKRSPKILGSNEIKLVNQIKKRLEDRTTMYANMYHREATYDMLRKLRTNVRRKIGGADGALFGVYIEGLIDTIKYASKNIRFAGDYTALHKEIMSGWGTFSNAFYRFVTNFELRAKDPDYVDPNIAKRAANKARVASMLATQKADMEYLKRTNPAGYENLKKILIKINPGLF